MVLLTIFKIKLICYTFLCKKTCIEFISSLSSIYAVFKTPTVFNTFNQYKFIIRLNYKESNNSEYQRRLIKINLFGILICLVKHIFIITLVIKF